MGEEVTKICLKVLNEEEDLRPINKTCISLIPKIEAPKFLTDYRPISLCSVVYKIIAKALANRLKKALEVVVS